MRQHRQASQEVLQRKAALQRIADRKQNSRRVLDSSSDSDSSGDGYRSGSPAQGSSFGPSYFRDSSNFRPAVESSQGEHKSLQRLSQPKENQQDTHRAAVASVRARTSNTADPAPRMSADGDQLATSLAGLAIAGNPNKRNPTAAVLAAAVATELPGEASDFNNEASDTSEANAKKSLHATGLHIAEFQLKARTANMLYTHQIEGVKWLWSLHKLRRGGILGDDMGLGKTMQCAAFLAGIFGSGLARRAVIIAPKTLLAHWEKELVTCGLGPLLFQYYGSSQGDRDYSLRRVATQKGILLTTYGMVLHNSDALSLRPMQRFSDDKSDMLSWDFMILDEGHKIKNPKTQLVQRLHEIPVAVRIIISGTPIQNNLMEMHSLFDFACEGLLGDAKMFKMEFEKRITAGNDKHATGRDRQIAAAKAAELRARIAPFFLRREKKDVLPQTDSAEQDTSDVNSSSTSEGQPQAPQPQAMGHKNDLIIWLQLHPAQRHIYEAFLESTAVRAALNKTGSALAALTVLKKICDHPTLLNERAASLVARAGGKLARTHAHSDDASEEEEEWYDASEDVEEEPPMTTGSWWEQDNVDAADVESHLLKDIQQKGVDTSCKTAFIMRLLAELVAKGHRTLIFSQSRVMLDILQAAIIQQSYQFRRIDGSISSATERQALVQEFQTTHDIPVFLLTTQVGGLGLTLTAADRVIIVDPAWNPSTDNQSVDRAYRIGQQKDVVVYRLITCGTVEEKIYKKQVFKGGLSRSGTEEGIAFRYFSQQDLRDLFRVVLHELDKSETQQALHQLHSGQRKATAYVQEHLQFLETLPRYAGVSDHDLMFSKKAEDSALQQSGGQWPQPVDSRQAARPPPPSAVRQCMANASVLTGQLSLILGVILGATVSVVTALVFLILVKSQLQIAAKLSGWAGSGDISDMLAGSLYISAPGSRGPFGSAPALSSAAPSAQATKSRTEELKRQISSLQSMITTSSAASLPDGGAKLHSRLASLHQELASLGGTASKLAETGAMPPAAHSQAQTAAAQAPSASAPQPKSAAVAGQADRHQAPAMPSKPNASWQHGNIAQHAADAPRQHIPPPLSEAGQIQAVDEAVGSRQVHPQLVSRMPKPLPQKPSTTANAAPAAATAPDNVHAQPSAVPSVQELTMQIKQMKTKMIHYASLLDNPEWKQQQPDGGKAVLSRAKMTRDQREVLKVQLNALQQHQQK